MYKIFERNAGESERTFRDGFWLKTIERFFVLAAFVEDDLGKAYFAAELDNIVFKAPKEFLEKISQKSCLAYPFLNESTAMASFLYIGGIAPIEKFCRYISEQKCYLPDMALLANFSQSHPDMVHAFTSENLLSASQYKPSQDNVLVDAAAFGQYYFGVDPRNVGRPLYNGFQNSDSGLDFRNVQTLVFADLSCAFVIYFGRKYRLLNLHVHSKIFDRLILSMDVQLLMSKLDSGTKTLIKLNFKNWKYFRSAIKLYTKLLPKNSK
jgi:hypothetical protein